MIIFISWVFLRRSGESGENSIVQVFIYGFVSCSNPVFALSGNIELTNGEQNEASWYIMSF